MVVHIKATVFSNNKSCRVISKCWILFLQKMFLVGLAIIAAVNADVSHLSNNNRGYNYQQPSPSFSEQLSLPAPAPQVRSSINRISNYISRPGDSNIPMKCLRKRHNLEALFDAWSGDTSQSHQNIILVI